jgi:hypothetical protein
MKWAGEHRFAYIPVVAGDNVILSFMRGRLLDDLDVVQLVGDNQGSWWESADSVVLIAGRRNRLAGVIGDADSIQMFQYTR